jgi:hypothetical protein
MGSPYPNLPLTDPEREASARLFALAPAMLRSLKGVVRVLVAVGHTVGLAGSQLTRLTEAQALIASAEDKP